MTRARWLNGTRFHYLTASAPESAARSNSAAVHGGMRCQPLLPDPTTMQSAIITRSAGGLNIINHSLGTNRVRSALGNSFPRGYA